MALFIALVSKRTSRATLQVASRGTTDAATLQDKMLLPTIAALLLLPFGQASVTHLTDWFDAGVEGTTTGVPRSLAVQAGDTIRFTNWLADLNVQLCVPDVYLVSSKVHCHESALVMRRL